MFMHNLLMGDCLEILPTITERVDLILADPPYGTTKCKWDSIIPIDQMWQALSHVRKPNTAVILFGGQPYTSLLITSNLQEFRYCFVWNKKKAANFLFGNKMPLKKTEDLAVFYTNQPQYYPQKTVNPRGPEKSGRKGIGNTIFDHLPNAPKQSKAGMSYEADMLLPDNILEFSKPHKPMHPTQKPVPLLEYLIKTYTKEGDTVLDFCMGSGSTGIAALNLGRKFIGIEKDATYFEMAKTRIETHR